MQQRFSGYRVAPVLYLLIALSTSPAFAQGDFSLAAAPASQVAWQAYTTDYLVTVNATGGFVGQVSFSVSGLPAGATATFNPTSVNAAGTTTLTVAAAPGTPTGSHTLAVSGTSGALNRNTSATLVVIAPPPITYTYDAVGRLTAVTNQFGQSATFAYDTVGNLLSISRQGTNELSLQAFAPGSGLPGTIVTILGSGFSSVPSENTVSFNGMPAVVSTSSNTQIRTALPSGATTGPITVTNTNGSVSSATAFVAGSGATPTISSFTPNKAVASALLTISGMNFDSNPASNVVKIAGTPLGVHNATTTSLVGTVPVQCGSGKVTVQTPFGSATSADDFFFVSEPYKPDDIISAGRTAWDTTNTIAFPRASSVALLLFEAAAGSKVRLVGDSTGNHIVRIYAPDGALVLNDTSLSSSGSIVDAPALALTGTYTALITGPIGKVNIILATPPAAGDFSMYALPEYYQFNPAGPSYKIFVSLGESFSQTVTLSGSGLPTGTTAVFSPAATYSTSVVRMTFNIGASPSGAYPFSASGTAGSISRSISGVLNIRPIPTPWVSADVGNPGIPGRAEYESGIFTLQGTNANNIFATDGFHFVYQTLTGDGTVVARVVSQENRPNSAGNISAYGDVMLRESLTYGSRTFQTRLIYGVGSSLRWRTTTDGPLDTAIGPAVSAPYWVKVTRLGNVFSGSISADGVTWTQIDTPKTIPLPETLYVGLTSTSDGFYGLARTVYDNVTVSSAPDFTITPSPAGATVAAGASTSYTVQVASLGGFSGAVSLNASGLPAGAVASFSPASINTSGSSTLTITTTAGITPAGAHTITIVGVAGTTTRTGTVVLTVAAPDFTIAMNPQSQTINAGSNGTYAINVTYTNGFTGPVNMSVTGVPSGSTHTLSPSTLSGTGSATLTITVGPDTARRTHTLTVIGTSGAMTRTATASLAVAPADFAVSVDSPWFVAPETGGTTVTRTVTVSVANGYNKTVQLSVLNLPPGATATFNPATVTGAGSSQVAITTAPGTAPRTYDIAIAGTASDTAAGNPRRSTPAVLVSHATGSLPGGWTETDIGSPLLPGNTGFATDTFIVQGAGASPSVTEDQLHFAYRTMSGDGTIIARLARHQGGSQWAAAGLMIRSSLASDSAQYYIAHLSDQTWRFSRGSNGASRVAVGGPMFSSPLWLKLVRQGSLCSGFASSDGMSWTEISSAQSISLTAAALVGFGVSSESPTTVRNGYFDNVLVTGVGPDFYLVPQPFSRKVSVSGGSTYFVLKVASLNAFVGAVTLSTSGLPAGATATITNSPIAVNGGSQIRIDTPAGLAPGVYRFNITGVSGGITRSTTVAFEVSGDALNLPTPWGFDFVGQATSGTTPVNYGSNAFSFDVADCCSNAQTDGLAFGYQMISGDAVLTARVASLSQPASGTNKAGVMFRESLEPGSKHIFSGSRFISSWGSTVPDIDYRLIDNGNRASSAIEQTASQYVPYWYKLARRANTYHTFGSSNGTHWSVLSDPVTLSLSGTVFAGIGATHGTSTLDNVSIAKTPDLLVTTAPLARTTGRSDSTVFTLTQYALNGLTGSVTYAASGLPVGATATFSPTSLTGDSTTTLTVTTSPTTPVGASTITVTATAGDLVRTLTLELTVVPSFTFAVTPVQVVTGTRHNAYEFVQFTLTVAGETGFNEAVSLSHEGAEALYPSFSNPVFVPPTITGSGTATYGFDIPDSRLDGTYLITFTATSSSGLRRSVVASVTLQPDFELAGPYEMIGTAGSTATQTIFLKWLSNLASDISLSANGLPSGATASFSPNPAVRGTSHSGSSTLAVTIPTSVPGGTHTFTIMGTAGGLTHSANVTLDVRSFNVAATPATRAIAPGASTTYAGTLTMLNGFNSTVTFSMEGLPSGATASFSPATRSTSGNTTVTINTTTSTPAGTYPLTLKGTTASGIVRTAPIELVISADFSISTSAGTTTVTATGASATNTVTVNALGGFSSPVSLTVTGLPTGATATFNPATVNGAGSSTLTIAAGATAPGGNSTLTITGTSGSLVRTKTITLTVRNFSLAVSPTSATISAGASGAYTTTLTMQGGYNSSVTFGASGLPTGVTATFSPTSRTTTGTTTLSVNTTAAAPLGTHPFTITGTNTSSGLSQSTSAAVVITDGFTLSTSPGSTTITAGANGSVTVTVATTAGLSGSTALSISGLPTGATAGFSPASVTGSGTSTLTITTTTATPGGTSTLTITGTNGALTRTATITLNVRSFGLAATPASRTITKGSSTTYTGTLTMFNGYNSSVAFSLVSPPAGVSASFSPASRTTSGNTTATINTTASTPTGTHTLTLRGTSGSIVKTTTVTLVVN